MKTILMILGLVVMSPLSSMNAEAAPNKTCSVSCTNGSDCSASGAHVNCECKAEYTNQYPPMRTGKTYASCSSGGMLVSHDGVPPAVDGYDAILQHNDAIFFATPVSAP